MKKLHLPRLLVSLALAASLMAPASAEKPRPQSAATLKTRISNMVQNAGLRGRAGIYIKVLKNDRVLYNERGEVPMIPASNQKILTTAAAMDLLGPDFRYQTELVGPEPDKNGVVTGHLYLRGSGDPSFCEPYNTPATEPFRFFVRQLRKQGVKAVVGDVVADDSAFDREFRGQGWFDRYLLDDYAAAVSALSVNANLVDVIVTADKISLNPSTTSVTIVKKVKKGSYTDVWVDRRPGTDVITVGGTIAPGSVVHRLITVDNPSMFSAGVFSSLLEKGGIPHRGSVRLIDAVGEPARLKDLKVYARFHSPRLVELARQINRYSDNIFAQHMFKTLGERHRGRGTAANAEACVAEFMRQHGVDPTGLNMVDGSGLSVLNRVSPRQLVGVLQAMWLHPQGQTFIDTLPAGGEGTLSYRLVGQTVRAKTGTLNGHSGLSGYVVTAYGQTVAFSVLVNDVDATWSAVDLQDRVVQTLAGWPGQL